MINGNPNRFLEVAAKCEENTCLECLNKFINDPIFDGKTFQEIEQEIEWVDW